MRTNIKRLVALGFALTVWSFDTSLSRADDTFYMIVFAYETRPNFNRFAHTFATFVKVSDPKGGLLQTAPLEGHTISWLPATLRVKPYRLHPEPGTNLDLQTTLEVARSEHAFVTFWGPYRIRKELYDKAMLQIDRLNRGEVAYKAIDRRFRPGIAIDCFHAVSDVIDEPLMHVGARYGRPASRAALNHLSPWIIDAQQTYPWIAARLGLTQ